METAKKKGQGRVSLEDIKNDQGNTSTQVENAVDSNQENVSENQTDTEAEDVVKVTGLSVKKADGSREISKDMVAQPVRPDKDIAELLDSGILDNLDEFEEAENLVPEYVEFNKGDSRRGMFVGFTEMRVREKGSKGEGDEYKTLEAAMFVSKDGYWMNAGVALVSDVKTYVLPGDIMSITLEDKRKTVSGNEVYVYKLRRLRPKK